MSDYFARYYLYPSSDSPNSKYPIETFPKLYNSTNVNFPSNSINYLLSYLMNNKSIDPIPCIWQNKLKMARFKISSLLNAISLRERLKENNIYHINQDICHLHTQQFALENDHSLGKYALNPQQFGLERVASGLEAEIRSEKVNCFKDLFSMKDQLIEAISQYLALKRKTDLLNLDPLPKYNA